MAISNKTKFSNYYVQKVVGKSTSKIKPVFNENASSIIQAVGKTGNEYSVSTGLHCKELFTCDDNIIGLSYSSHLRLFTDKGCLLQYNRESNQLEKILSVEMSGEVLNEFKVAQFTSKKWAHEDWRNLVEKITFVNAVVTNDFVLAAWCIPSEKHAHGSLFKINKNDTSPIVVYPWDAVQKNNQSLAVGSDFVVLLSKNSVFVAKLFSPKGKTHKIGSHKFSAVAAHPIDPVFATGDSAGKIIVWRNIHDKFPLREVLHWHTLPVKSLMFTECGSNLLSGGNECVLVKWSLVSYAKTFLPRLSSAIEFISGSSDNSCVAVSTADDKITIINLSLACLSTIQQFSGWDRDRISAVPILTQDPRTGALVLSGRTGHLQFISTVSHGQFLYTLDVTQKNYVTHDPQSNPYNADVTLAKFTPCGKWLVTVEIECDKEARLKVWSLKEETQEWDLNTDIFMPHGPGGLHTLQGNQKDLFLTTGPDNMFRLWGLHEITHVNKTRTFWTQLGCDSYRMLSCGPADFSRDGSLFTVGFGPALTLWDTENVSFKCSLTPPLQRTPLTDIKFGNDRESHLIVTATMNELSCWNIVTLCRQWVVRLDRVQLLISDPNSTYMAVISGRQGLFIFEPSSPEPNWSTENVSSQTIMAGLFVAKSENPQLYFLTERQELLTVGGASASHEAVPPCLSEPTTFSTQIADLTRKDVERSTGVVRVLSISNNANSVLHGATHALPHVASLTEFALLELFPKVNSNAATTTSKPSESASFSQREQIKKEKLSAIGEAELSTIVKNMFNELKK